MGRTFTPMLSVRVDPVCILWSAGGQGGKRGMESGASKSELSTTNWLCDPEQVALHLSLGIYFLLILQA
jgi:hypothetical protein